VALYDEEMEVEALGAFDEQDQVWLGQTNWSTRRDLALPSSKDTRPVYVVEWVATHSTYVAALSGQFPDHLKLLRPLAQGPGDSWPWRGPPWPHSGATRPALSPNPLLRPYNHTCCTAA
jgi:hypothetical protein